MSQAGWDSDSGIAAKPHYHYCTIIAIQLCTIEKSFDCDCDCDWKL
jgi:hypothetical protein